MAPLSGIRVLDLSRLLPGPYATLILADLGAEVIKVEDPRGGDYIRYAPPLVGPHGALFAALNRGKKSVTLDLKDPGDRERFLELVTTADVLVESFRPGVLDRLGVGWEVVRERNPRLIWCAITGYGPEGSYSQRAGHDLNYIALAGLLGISGQDPERPAFPGGQVADVGGGSLMATIAILAALHERVRTDRGQRIEVGMAQGVLAFLTMHLAAWLADRRSVDPRPGTMQLNGAHCCYTIYQAKDGRWFTLAALEPKFWENFCTAIGRDDLRGRGFDPARPGEATYEAVVAEFASRTSEEWIALNAEHDFCCEPVLTFADVVEHPVFRDLFFELEAEGHRWPQVEIPLGMAGVSGRRATPPPKLGEHNAEILGT